MTDGLAVKMPLDAQLQLLASLFEAFAGRDKGTGFAQILGLARQCVAELCREGFGKSVLGRWVVVQVQALANFSGPPVGSVETVPP